MTGKGDGEAGSGFLLALAASLMLHLAVIYGVEVVPPRHGDGRPFVLQARIAPQPDVKAALAAPGKGKKEIMPPPSSAQAEPEPAAEASRPETAPPPPESLPGLPAVEMPLPEDPTYYPTRDLDVLPVQQHPVLVKYPAGAANIAGMVEVLLLVDEAGTVREATVTEADPPGYFEQAVLEAARNARYVPGQRKGRDVKSRIRVRVCFEPAGDSPASAKCR